MGIMANNVKFAWQLSNALKKYCLPSIFECVYYDGEHGEYRLFDFNPNGLSNESIRIEVRSRLEYEIGVEPDYIDKAMESVFDKNSNEISLLLSANIKRWYLPLGFDYRSHRTNICQIRIAIGFLFFTAVYNRYYGKTPYTKSIEG